MWQNNSFPFLTDFLWVLMKSCSGQWEVLSDINMSVHTLGNIKHKVNISIYCNKASSILEIIGYNKVDNIIPNKFWTRFPGTDVSAAV